MMPPAQVTLDWDDNDPVVEERMLGRSFVLLSVGMFLVLAGGLGPAALGGDDRLAIKGYDPVAYFTDAKPTLGDPQYQYEWDGSVYYFASAEHLELFKVDPDRYVPRHHNLCTIALSRGVMVIADPNSWIIHEGQLYLFGQPIGRERLLADPVGIKERADANHERLSQLPDPVE
jgi:YHS domain-containing protein